MTIKTLYIYFKMPFWIAHNDKVFRVISPNPDLHWNAMNLKNF